MLAALSQEEPTPNQTGNGSAAASSRSCSISLDSSVKCGIVLLSSSETGAPGAAEWPL